MTRPAEQMLVDSEALFWVISCVLVVLGIVGVVANIRTITSKERMGHYPLYPRPVILLLATLPLGCGLIGLSLPFVYRWMGAIGLCFTLMQVLMLNARIFTVMPPSSTVG